MLTPEETAKLADLELKMQDEKVQHLANELGSLKEKERLGTLTPAENARMQQLEAEVQQEQNKTQQLQLDILNQKEASGTPLTPAEMQKKRELEQVVKVIITSIQMLSF